MLLLIFYTTLFLNLVGNVVSVVRNRLPPLRILAKVFLKLFPYPFITLLIGEDAKVGLITADSKSFSADLLAAVGVSDSTNLVIGGLEDSQQFTEALIQRLLVQDKQAATTNEARTVLAGCHGRLSAML